MITDPFSRAVGIPLVGIFMFQTVITMGAYALPVVIPVAAPDLGLRPESVGFLVAVLYGLGMVSGLVSGSLISRLGPTRLFQLLLVLTALAVTVLWLSSPMTAVLAAMILGCASGPMNPVGSHVLGRVTPVRIRALVFSVKQCGTPAGGMLAGALLPPLMLLYDWRIALGLLLLFSIVLLAAAPLARLGGPEEGVAVGAGGQLSRAWGSLRTVMAEPTIRAVTLSGTCLGLAQMGIATYLVVFLWQEVGYSPDRAGLVFAFLHVSGIASRVLLGALTDRLPSAKWVLVGICAVLAGSLYLTTTMTAAWPVPLVYALTALIGASGNGWVGLYFAELARLSPPERIAEVAGGSQFFTYIGLVIGPTLYGAILQTTGSYQWCFVVFGSIALAGGAFLALAARR